MKRALSALTVVLLMLSAGCSSPVKRAEESFALAMNSFIDGTFDETHLDNLVDAFDKLGMPPEADQDFVDSVRAMCAKLSYKIISCTADQENEDAFTVIAELTTIDGHAVFTNDSVIESALDKALQMAIDGQIEQTDINSKFMVFYIAGVKESSAADSAFQTTSVELKILYNHEDDSFEFADGTVAQAVINLNIAGLETELQEKVAQKTREKLAQVIR